MNYGLMYTLPFANFRNEACVVEIEKENYTGDTMELIGAELPFEVDIEDDDFLYIPTRFSTARIRVVGSDYLQSLFSTAYQQYRVTFKRGGVVTWCGFVKPEVYTQDYSSDKFELEIECMSAMSVLEFINYNQYGKDGKVFVSLWDLLKKCIESSRGKYSAVYIPHVYARDKREYDLGMSNILEYMTVSEQNFFDEDGKAMKLKELLEEICKFLNWTCIDYLGSLYFIDADHSGDYHCYDMLPNWNAFLTVSPKSVMNVQEIGFSGSDHTRDNIPGRNKCTVKTSNYPVVNVLPTEDYDENKEIDSFVANNGDQRCLKVRVQPQKWVLYNTEWTYCDAIRYCKYNIVNGRPDITEYNYIDVLEIKCRELNEDVPIVGLGQYNKIMSFKSGSSSYQSGAFCISGAYKTIGALDKMIPWNNSRGTWMKLLGIQLRIGTKYYGSRDGLAPYTWDVDAEKYVHVGASTGNNDCALDYVNIANIKTLDMPYKGASGIIMPINEMLAGELELTLYAANLPDKKDDVCAGFFLKDFSLKYVKKDGEQKEENNSDRYYENIVNEYYINELDEIEFKISSYNNDGACHSKVLLDDNYLTNNLYSVIVDKAIRPEEHLIQRIVNHYDATRIKLTQVIKETPELTPLTKLSDNFVVDKIFMPIGGSIDYKMGQFKCVMVEV